MNDDPVEIGAAEDGAELNDVQKLQLAERANEIYRQQLKYMQDHLASLRSLIQDKENIIENLMLRYDLGIIAQDADRQGGNLAPDEIEVEELRRKAEALAQRTILENFELREMVNELRDELVTTSNLFVCHTMSSKRTVQTQNHLMEFEPLSLRKHCVDAITEKRRALYMTHCIMHRKYKTTD